MRLALISWLVLALSATAQVGGFGGGTGGGSSGSSGSGSGFGGSSGSSMGTSTTTAGVSSQTLLNSFGTSGSSRNNSAIASSNPFSSYYYNPYAQGLISGSGTASTITGFGQAVFSTSGTGGAAAGRTNSGVSGGFGSTNSLSSSGARTTGAGASGTGASTGFGGGGSSTSTTGMLGGSGGSNVGAFGANQQNLTNRGTTGTNFANPSALGNSTTGALGNRMGQTGFSPAAPGGLKSGVLYTTTLRFSVPTQPPAVVQAQLSGVVARSTQLAAPGRVRLEYDNGLVILRGTVASEDEAIHTENLLRLEPGVREVRNELRIGN